MNLHQPVLPHFLFKKLEKMIPAGKFLIFIFKLLWGIGGVGGQFETNAPSKQTASLAHLGNVGNDGEERICPKSSVHLQNP